MVSIHTIDGLKYVDGEYVCTKLKHLVNEFPYAICVDELILKNVICDDFEDMVALMMLLKCADVDVTYSQITDDMYPVLYSMILALDDDSPIYDLIGYFVPDGFEYSRKMKEFFNYIFAN